jgi:hypothetical protein
MKLKYYKLNATLIAYQSTNLHALLIELISALQLAADSKHMHTLCGFRPRIFLGLPSPESESLSASCFSRLFRTPATRPLRFFSPSAL